MIITKVELRSDNEVRVSGYVNAVERDSKVLPAVMSPGAHGSFVERVAAGAFGRAVGRNPDIRMLFNHEREIGSVRGGQLKLTEDNIGLRAEAVVTDPEAVNAAKRGELRGWSFGFSGARDIWEDYKPGIQRRTLTDFDLLEVSLLTKSPAYYGTSVETRGDTPQYSVVEIRGEEDNQTDEGSAAFDKVILREGERAENAAQSSENASAPSSGIPAGSEQRAALDKAKASAEYYKRTIEFLETGGF